MTGFVLLEGGNALNLWAPSGTSFPVSPTAGDYFYRTDLSTLYMYNGSAWAVLVPSEEPSISLSTLDDVNLSPLTTGQNLSWNGTKWINSTPAAVADPVYDIAGSILGVPLGGAVVARFVTVRPFSLLANLPNSMARCSTAATGTVILTIKKDSSVIGTINFGSGATAGTFVLNSTVTFAPGDVLTVTNQSVPDATFGHAEFTIVASLS